MQRLQRPADTLYFGGGTPSVLGGERLSGIIAAARPFLTDDAEITVEANPADHLYDDFKKLRTAGANRLSIGVQSCIPSELAAISRRHTPDDAKRTVKDAKKAGFDNISVDLMLGLPHQTADTLKSSLEFAVSLDIQHISCYILKLEPKTPLFEAHLQSPQSLALPDEDTAADMYLYMSDYLQKHGFFHYEISNFAKEGFCSRHNLKYWNDGEYLGLGPAAHSFLNGKRFYFERSTAKYLSSPAVIPDGNGGDAEEKIMLKLRLAYGIGYGELEKLIGRDATDKFKVKAKFFSDAGLAVQTEDRFALTDKGFLVSNALIGELICLGE